MPEIVEVLLGQKDLIREEERMEEDTREVRTEDTVAKVDLVAKARLEAVAKAEKEKRDPETDASSVEAHTTRVIVPRTRDKPEVSTQVRSKSRPSRPSACRTGSICW